MVDTPENVNDNPKSWIAWKRESEQLQAERDRLRNAISKAIKTHWDIKLLSSDQCEAIDGLEAALRREGENGNSGR